MAGLLLGVFYVSMAAAGFVTDLLFTALGLVPRERQARVIETAISWNYTTILNILFLLLAAALVWRFLRTGGPRMLRMMNEMPHGAVDHD
jgi:hypothetical protein